MNVNIRNSTAGF